MASTMPTCGGRRQDSQPVRPHIASAPPVTLGRQVNPSPPIGRGGRSASSPSRAPAARKRGMLSGEVASATNEAGGQPVDDRETSLTTGTVGRERGMMAERLELTVLMPCLDEAATVGRCVERAGAFLRRAGIAGEVLVADNGSRDGSQAI